MYTELKHNSELDRRCLGWIMDSTHGEAFVAMDVVANKRVVMKKVKLEEEIENEYQLLKECRSPLIVGYYDVLKREKELWVRFTASYVIL